MKKLVSGKYNRRSERRRYQMLSKVRGEPWISIYLKDMKKKNRITPTHRRRTL